MKFDLVVFFTQSRREVCENRSSESYFN